jgi:hypothetical protein
MTDASSQDDQRAELARTLAVLSKIRDIVDCPDPRFVTLEWYKAIVMHVRRYLAEIYPGDD